jgi:phosphoribosylamine--glycine ligase
MKVLVIGGGGREHALAWKIARSPGVETIYAAPGNAGIAGVAECVPVGAGDLEGLCALAIEKGVDLTVVGPEAPLVAGIADLFRRKGLRIFGFTGDGARLEGSKVWAKEFMKRHRIPTGAFAVCDDPAGALEALEAGSPPFVIKADGRAGVRRGRREDHRGGISERRGDLGAFYLRWRNLPSLRALTGPQACVR